jgi:hypothetical protein
LQADHVGAVGLEEVDDERCPQGVDVCVDAGAGGDTLHDTPDHPVVTLRLQ